MLENIFRPSRSFGEASAFACGLAESGEFDCWANAAVDIHGQMMAREAKVTNGIRIPASVLADRGGRERSIPAAPAIVIV